MTEDKDTISNDQPEETRDSKLAHLASMAKELGETLQRLSIDVEMCTARSQQCLALKKKIQLLMEPIKAAVEAERMTVEEGKARREVITAAMELCQIERGLIATEKIMLQGEARALEKLSKKLSGQVVAIKANKKRQARVVDEMDEYRQRKQAQEVTPEQEEEPSDNAGQVSRET